MALALAVLTLMGTLCPEASDVTGELAAQGVVLSEKLRVATEETEAGVEVALFQGERRVEARLVEGEDCAARTRSAAAFVAGWSLALSRALAAPPPREVRTVVPPPAPRSSTLTVVHRVSGEAQVSFWSAGIGFQGTVDYGLGLEPWLLIAGALIDVVPDVRLDPGIVSRTTLAFTAGVGLERPLGPLALAGVVGAAIGGSIVTGRGFDVSGTAGAFELGLRGTLRLRLTTVRWLPGLSAGVTVWPGRQGAVVQGIPGHADAGQWEFCLGAHLAFFP